eukprot:GGOE01042840.1.p2 GENE.GGOE01042840.1~~GGOE01042840.1.p2  ORF type:complete len:566 (-),score=246.83 GGOE01042840.1:14-1666(-)
MESAGPSMEAPLTAAEKRKTEKELLEARKAGTIPAELDEDGKEINPHIPLYMANAPWYLGDSKPGLKHQRSQFHREYDKLGTWYARGQRAGPAPTKFRKGACENCGAMTHKAKDCVERPRKTGAKFTGKDLQADEVVVECNLAYDGKRDRWNGYDPATHSKYIAEFELQEAERKAVKTRELELAVKAGTVSTDALNKDEDLEQDAIVESEEKKLARGAGCEDVRTRTTIRNLRIREDTAKYLLNLDLNSAHYDPKTRSMRGNPYAEGEQEDKVYAGDNALRHSGEALDVVQMQVFCWDANNKGTEVHLQAAPTHAEKLYANFKAKKEILKQETKRKLLEKYGGEEHLQAAPRELLFGQTEAYVQYSRDGKLLKGAEKSIPSSKYEEDVYRNNHTTVWGSYWEAGKWGYCCCHQFCRNSYCLGAAAKKAPGVPLQLEGTGEEKEKDFQQAKEDVQRALEQRQLLERMRQLNEAMLQNEEDTSRRAEEEERERQRRKRERDELATMDDMLDDRRRKYNSGRADHEVTEEEMEEFRRSAIHEADPMRQFLQNG